jgi:1-acyl-sn-glycerol-3-phosphate acyltransferase
MDLMRLVGYVISKSVWFIRYSGLENIPPKSIGGFVIASNHPTYIDPVWVCMPMRRKMRFMAFDKAFQWRFIGPLISYLGAFPVPLEVGGTLKAIKESLRSLRDGSVLAVFPEGAREFADGKFHPFKTGAVRIAHQAGVPILPVTIRGANRIWPQGQRYPSLFRRVEVIYHPVYYLAEPEPGNREYLEQWTDELRAIIASAYEPLVGGD